MIRWFAHRYLQPIWCRLTSHNVDWYEHRTLDTDTFTLFYCTRCLWWEQGTENNWIIDWEGFDNATE